MLYNVNCKDNKERALVMYQPRVIFFRKLEEIGFVLFLLDLHINLSRIRFRSIPAIYFRLLSVHMDYEQIAPYMHIHYMDMMLHASLDYC